MSPSASQKPTIAVTDRDLAILRGLFEARVMTLAHIATFYFEGRLEAATKRVQKLKRAGLVSERPRRAYDPSILFLTRSAFRELTKRGALTDYPPVTGETLEKRVRVSPFTLRHELDVLDVRAAFWKAVAAEHRYEVVEFTTWPRLSEFSASPGPGLPDMMVRPDGFIRITEREPDGGMSESTFYLEVDRSSEVQGTLAAKAACYADHYRRGGLAVRFGRPREEYKLFPFRVLVVCRNAERRNNAAGRMLQNQPPILTQVWLTTIADVTTNPLGPIWVQPVDYRSIVAGTRYDIDARRSEPTGNRRQSEREQFIERSVEKRWLLSNQ